MSNKSIYEISIIEAFAQFVGFFKKLKSKLKLIFLISVIFGFAGLVIAFLTPVKYQARITFLVEDSKASAGGLSSLAGQFGIDLGGNTGGGFLSSDNILLYFNSELLIRDVLFSTIDNNDSIYFVDDYANSLGLKKRWKEKGLGEIQFSKLSKNDLPRLEDSLIQVIVNDHILKHDLTIGKLDKKSSFIELKVSMKKEKLSKFFSEKILAIAAEKYIDSKVRVKAKNVEILQHRADSLSFLLNQKTKSSAIVQQTMVDINPAIKTAPVNVEISTREKATIAAVYGEVVKNLELSKTILSQVTPVVQIIDSASFPLKIEKPSKVKYFMSFFVLGLLFSFIFFGVKYLIKRK